MIAKSEREEWALRLLQEYLFNTRGERWVAEAVRPDHFYRNLQACDYILANEDSGNRAGLEITMFDWLLNSNDISHAVKDLAESLQDELKEDVSGTFTLSADVNALDDAKLLKRNKGRRQALIRWMRDTGASMSPGRIFAVPGIPGLTILRHASDGPLQIRVPVLTTRIAYPDWMHDLEWVIADNMPKFEVVGEVPRWLLIHYPGIGDKLELTGPALRLPAHLDELFFIDQEDRSGEWPPEEPQMSYWIVEYRNIQSPAHFYDPDTGALKVAVPFAKGRES